MTTYEEAVAYLAALEGRRGWDLGLERMRAVCARRGHPERRFAVVHIAGTNGKGSTAAMVERVLREAGHRTGLYTSPHLVDFAERMRANGATIPRDRVLELVRELQKVIEAAAIPLTHFEFVTLLAFEWFAEIGVQIAVVEVGLGGRLDATNVVIPVVTAIASIALDHEAFLGDTLAAIAREKAGIAKPGVPLVLGEGLPGDADEAIVMVAAKVGAPILRASRSAAFPVALGGHFQERNAATACRVLAAMPSPWRCDDSAVRAGLANTEWPGRLAVVGHDPLVVLDGAHNPAGAIALATALPKVVGKRRMVLVFAVMADKACDGILAPLLPLVDQVIVTRVGRRGLDPAVLAQAIGDRVPVRLAASTHAAMGWAISAAGAEGAVVVAGSLFLVGEAYSALKGPEVRLFPEWHGWDRFGTGAPR